MQKQMKKKKTYPFQEFLKQEKEQKTNNKKSKQTNQKPKLEEQNAQNLEITKKLKPIEEAKKANSKTKLKPNPVSQYEIYLKMFEILEGQFEFADVPFRTKESTIIKEFITQNLQGTTEKRILLISGMPGSGKTLTANTILNNCLQNNKLKKTKFQIIKKNAMDMPNAAYFLKSIYNDIASQSKNQISNEFEIINQIKRQLSRQKTLKIIMIDEIDQLFKKMNQESQQAMFQLIDLNFNEKYHCILIGISNTMDLIYSICDKFRVNLNLVEQLVFGQYKLENLQKIIYQKIDYFHQQACSTSEQMIKFFDESAVKLCAIKIYKIKGGDVRCIFEACKKALRNKLDQIEKNTEQLQQLQQCENVIEPINPITNQELWKAFNELYQPSMQKEVITTLPMSHQIMLASIHIQTRKLKSQELLVTELVSCFERICNELELIQSTRRLEEIQEILITLENYELVSISRKFKLTAAQQEGTVEVRIKNQDIYEGIKDNDMLVQFIS